ncbi:MAG: cyclic nucleotide-binding domain-containing protein [Nitrospinaceae bacterium]
MENLKRILSDHPFLKGLEPRYVDLLAGCASNVRFDAGTFIFREGEEANQFYILRHGKVALEIHDESRGPITLETLQEGDVLGWSWLVPPYHWQMDAQAVDLTRAIALDGKCLRTKCLNDHNLGYELLMRIVPLIVDRLHAARIQLLDVYGVKP